MEVEQAGDSTADVQQQLQQALAQPNPQPVPRRTSDQLARLVDLRGLTKPPTFDGEVSHWQEFRYQFESVAVLLGFREAMREVLEVTAEQVEAVTLKWVGETEVLHALLTQLVSGRALLILRHDECRCGLTGWRNLVLEYEPESVARTTAMLSAVLQPPWVGQRDFWDQLMEWETQVRRYEVAARAQLPPGVKVAVILRHAPRWVKDLVKTSSVDLMTSYVELKAAIHAYYLRGRVFTGMGQLSASTASASTATGVAPMEVDMATFGGLARGRGRGAGGKGKSSGRGGGRGKGDGQYDAKWNSAPSSLPQQQQQQQQQAAGKGKNKGKGKPPWEAGRGQQQQQMPQQSPWRSEGGASGMNKFSGKCFRCGGRGRRKSECRALLVLEDGTVTGQQLEPSVSMTTPSVQTAPPEIQRPLSCPSEASVAMSSATALARARALQQHAGNVLWASPVTPLEEDDLFKYHVGKWILLLVDSGACDNVCPADFAVEAGWEIDQSLSQAELQLMTASGQMLQRIGVCHGLCKMMSGMLLEVSFQVYPVARPVLSVARLQDLGFELTFGDTAYLSRGGHHEELWSHLSLFFLPVQLVDQQGYVDDVWTPPLCPKQAVPTNVLSSSSVRWVLFEVCCSEESLLSTWFEAQGHTALRFGLPDHDLLEQATVDNIVDLALAVIQQKCPLILWFSLPCSPWCSWQRVNLKIGSTDLRDRIYRDRESGLQLMWAEVEIFHRVLPASSRAFGVHEWPRWCEGWQQEPAAYILECLPLMVDVDGCAFGLSGEKGLVNKPWRWLTNCRALEPLGQWVCTRDHPHQQCRGKLASQTAFYNHKLVEEVGQRITNYQDEACPRLTLFGAEGVPLMPSTMPATSSDDPHGSTEQHQQQSLDVDVPPTLLPQLSDPNVLPPVLEQRAHELSGHLPYAAWCRLCVMSKGRDQPHRSLDRRSEEAGLDLVEIDFTYMTTQDPQDDMQTVLVANARRYNYGCGLVCRTKSSSDPYVIQTLLRFFTESGTKATFRLRSDSEQAIVGLAQQVALKRPQEATILETTAVASSSSLGGAERYAQALAGQVRCLRLVVRQTWRREVSAASPYFPWMVLHAGWLLNRFQPCAVTGKTPYEELHGRSYRSPLFSFSRAVLVRRPHALVQAKLEPRWDLGVWLGRTAISDVHMVATKEGIVLSRAARPVHGEASPDDFFDLVQWKPWQLHGMHQYVRHMMKPPRDLLGDARPSGPQQPQVQGGASSTSPWMWARRFRKEVGLTDGCKGCVEGTQGGAKHITECQRRRAVWEAQQRQQQEHERVLSSPPVATDPPAEESLPVETTKHEQVAEQLADELASGADIVIPADVDMTSAGGDGQDVGQPPSPDQGPGDHQDDQPPPLVDDSDDEASMGGGGQQPPRGAKRERDEAMEQQAAQDEVHARGDPKASEGPSLHVLFGGECNLVTKIGPPWYDTVTNELLDPVAVEQGMNTERQSWDDLSVFDLASWDEYHNTPGAELVRSGWVLRLKSTGKVRARLVATQVNWGSWVDAFAATPTNMALRICLWFALLFGFACKLGDVSVAFLHAWLPAWMLIFVVPPATELAKLGAKALWRARKALYGLRVAPKIFQEHFAEIVKSLGFLRLKSEPQLFYHLDGAVMLVHADDILLCSRPSLLKSLQDALSNKFRMKWEAELLADRWVRYLGREYQYDPHRMKVKERLPTTYYQKLFKTAGLEGGRVVATPFAGAAELLDKTPLEPSGQTLFRNLTGQMIWLGPSRPESLFAIKECARAMQNPTIADLKRAKRVVRYFLATADHVLELKVNPFADESTVVVVDASWASSIDMKSTSGVTLTIQNFALEHLARTQSVIAQSSGESELMACNLGVAEAKLAQSIVQELGRPLRPVCLMSDSTACLGMLHRVGPGKLRHIAIKQLWLQQEIHDGKLIVQQHDTKVNVSDLMTKALPRERFEMLRELVGVRVDHDKVAVNMLEVSPAVVEDTWAHDEEPGETWLDSPATVVVHHVLLIAGCIQIGKWMKQVMGGCLSFWRRLGHTTSTPSAQHRQGPAVTPFRAGTITPYVCYCGLQLPARQVQKEGPNKGKWYVTCIKSRADESRCGYFRWI